MEYTDIIFDITDGIATITLNRPEVGNAFSAETSLQVIDALRVCGVENSVKVVVLTGSGKHFSAGGDIRRFKMLIETKQYLEADNIRRYSKVAYEIRRCPKPVIAMVNGAAAGAGCGIALACDFRIMTPRSKMVMSFVNIGLSGDTGGLYHMQKLIGIARTTELMMTGDPINGEKAKDYGLATILAEEDSLKEATYAFAAKIARKATFAIAKQKALMLEFFYQDLPSFCERETEYMEACSRTEDFSEAVYAFLEKRPPEFKGR